MADLEPVLRVIRGATRTEAFLLEPGTTRVGRAATCTISIADDGLSREHFDVLRTERECRVRDLGSRNGLRVNGRPVHEARLEDGDEITAGTVVFRFELAREGRRIVERTGDETSVPNRREPFVLRPVFVNTPTSLSAVAPPAPAGSLRASLADACRVSGDQRLYALVDGAAAFELAFVARMMGHGLFTLFAGDMADVVARVGPCLVALGEPSAFLDRWAGQLGTHAGVLLLTTAEPAALGVHLRQVFEATDEEGQEYFFRFYDPRVLRVFLPTCHEAELREFFGPVNQLIAENEEGTGLVAYAREGASLRTTTIYAAPGVSP